MAVTLLRLGSAEAVTLCSDSLAEQQPESSGCQCQCQQVVALGTVPAVDSDPLALTASLAGSPGCRCHF
jgi:hypothetical protein